MRIPLICANFSFPVYIDGTAKNRVTVGEGNEHKAKRLEYDTKLKMVFIWPKRVREVKSADGKTKLKVGLQVAAAESFDVADEHAHMFDEDKPAATVKPGAK
jgi:hypothetical protein